MNTKPMTRHTLISESLIKRVEQESYLLVWKGDEPFFHCYDGVTYEMIEARHVVNRIVTFFGVFRFTMLEFDHAGYLFKEGNNLTHGVDCGLGLDHFGEQLVFESNDHLATDTPIKLYGGF